MSITLLDGGMGQEVTRRSGVAPTPLWSTRVMLDNPEIVQSAHLDFINAGADIIKRQTVSQEMQQLIS